MSYKNGDFKAYFCNKLNRHVWVLGYFGGGWVNFEKFAEAAKDFSETTGIPIGSVEIGEIYSSRRFKGFKFITSVVKNQSPAPGSEVLDDVFGWLHD